MSADGAFRALNRLSGRTQHGCARPFAAATSHSTALITFDLLVPRPELLNHEEADKYSKYFLQCIADLATSAVVNGASAGDVNDKLVWNKNVMNKKLMIAVGLAVGLPVLNVNAEFSGYYAINTPGPGGQISIDTGSFGPVTQGNWSLKSEGRSLVEFQRSPSDSGIAAEGFSLTVRSGGSPANMGSFEILQPNPPPSPLPLLDIYTFQYSFQVIPGNKAWYVDADGVKPLTNAVGSGLVFNAPRGGAGQLWGFFVESGSAQSAVLQIQDWQQVPEPSAVAMALVTGLGALGFSVRKYRLLKSRKG